jgi:hypothetical protein
VVVNRGGSVSAVEAGVSIASESMFELPAPGVKTLTACEVADATSVAMSLVRTSEAETNVVARCSPLILTCDFDVKPVPRTTRSRLLLPVAMLAGTSDVSLIDEFGWPCACTAAGDASMRIAAVLAAAIQFCIVIAFLELWLVTFDAERFDCSRCANAQRARRLRLIAASHRGLKGPAVEAGRCRGLRQSARKTPRPSAAPDLDTTEERIDGGVLVVRHAKSCDDVAVLAFQLECADCGRGIDSGKVSE